jgi:hypothetical protein
MQRVLVPNYSRKAKRDKLIELAAAHGLVSARFFLFRDHRSVSFRGLVLLYGCSLAFDELRARVRAAHSVAPETRSFRARPSSDHCSGRSPMVSFQSRCMPEQSVCHLRCCEFSASLEKSPVISGRKPLAVAEF